MNCLRSVVCVVLPFLSILIILGLHFPQMASSAVFPVISVDVVLHWCPFLSSGNHCCGRGADLALLSSMYDSSSWRSCHVFSDVSADSLTLGCGALCFGRFRWFVLSANTMNLSLVPGFCVFGYVPSSEFLLVR